MKHLFATLIAIAFFGVLEASAFNLIVIFRVDETNEKTMEFVPMLMDSSDFSSVADVNVSEADSSFFFKDVPSLKNLMVLYQVEQSTYGENVKPGTDSITIYIPAYYLKQPTMLKELTVTASDRNMSAEKDTYIPTSKTKKISANGTDLIRNIGITTLQVSAVDGTISTVSGQPVSTFIDFRPASRTDVRNIRAEDVKSVDVYDFPSDPRFGGAQHVVNYVMMQYEFGGYTKFDAGQYTVVNNGMYGAYSKFAYKKMVYDIGVDFDYTRNHHDLSEQRSVFSYPGRDVDYTRHTDASLTNNRNISAFLRAAYQTKKLSISNTVSFTHNRVPDNNTSATEHFSSPDYISGSEASVTNNTGRTLAWEGNYQFNLAGNMSLVLEPKASYADNDRDYTYTAGTASIRNLVDEKAWRGYLSASLRKAFGNHSATARLYGNVAGNNIDYGGTTPSTQDGRNVYGGLWMQGNFSFGKFRFLPSVTLYAERLKVNDYRESNFAPKFFINGVYLFSNKNKTEFSAQYYQETVGQRYKTDFLQFQNQIFAIAGNPDIKLSNWFDFTLQHTYMPFSALSATIYGSYTYSDKSICADYVPMQIDGHDMMVRRFVNAGTTNKAVGGLSINSNLFDGALNLTAHVNCTYQNVNGPFSDSGAHVMCNLSARYIFANFFISAYYQSKNKTISPYGIERIPDYYFFNAGWGNGHWQLSAYAFRPFSKSYKCRTVEIYTNDYTNFRQDYSAGYHCRFALCATYSFSYGKKKVSHNIDTNLPSGPDSQILK